jgi:hypothetical protein
MADQNQTTTAAPNSTMEGPNQTMTDTPQTMADPTQTPKSTAGPEQTTGYSFNVPNLDPYTLTDEDLKIPYVGDDIENSSSSEWISTNCFPSSEFVDVTWLAARLGDGRWLARQVYNH